ncbi:MAG: ABC transporter permease [Phycisphaerae bacterium]
MFGDVIAARPVLWNLAWREIRVRYKQSYMGVAWALLVPLAMMLIFTFVFARVTRISETLAIGMPYALFAYIGLLPWTFFAQSVGQSTQSLVANRSLVTKIYFPRQVLPISVVVSSLFDFAVASLVLVGLVGYFHLFTEWRFEPGVALIWLPVVFGVQLILMVGLSLWFSLGNLFYRDVKYVVTVGLQLWMFVTNVIYPLKTSNEGLQALINANPMTPIIDAYRRALVLGLAPDMGPFVGATLISVGLLVSGWWVFEKAEPKFAECV